MSQPNVSSLLKNIWLKLTTWFPPATWRCGRNATDGLYNIETVVLRQNNTIEKGQEKCHHLSACIVGHEKSGKSSLIRKLTGKEFMKDLPRTNLVETQTLSPPREVIEEKLIKTRTWQICEDEADVDELVSETVRRSLEQGYKEMRGETWCGLPVIHYAKLLVMVFLTLFIMTENLLYGEKMMIGVIIVLFIGVALFGLCDPVLRMSLGCIVLMIVVLYYHGYLILNELEGNQKNYEAINHLQILWKSLFAAVVWGIFAGTGMNPGIAAGLATFDLKKANADARKLLNLTHPQLLTAIDQLSPWHLDINCAGIVILNLGVLALLLLSAYLIGNLCIRYKKMMIGFVMSLIGTFIVAWMDQLTGLTKVFFDLLIVLICLTVSILFLSIEKSITEPKKASGLKKEQILYNWIVYHTTGVIAACVFSWYLLEWPFAISSASNFIDRIAAVLFISILGRISPIAEYFGSRYVTAASTGAPSNVLPSYFKLIVRDFAGQAKYHTMHQPFLPKLGIFICVFSWERAKAHEQECLSEIIFWLNNIAMHKSPFTETGNMIDEQNIKNIILVGTHSETCGLGREAKDAIIKRYMDAIRRHPYIYSCIDMNVNGKNTAVLDIENSSNVQTHDIDKLKSYLIERSKEVLEIGFKQPLAVASWCWLAKLRSDVKMNKCPPYKRYVEALDSFKVSSSQEKDRILDVFRNVGEIFTVEQTASRTGTSRMATWENSYMFFNIQFIIDFMNNLATLDPGKMSHRKNGSGWVEVGRTGKGNVTLLIDYVKEYHKVKGLKDPYSKKKDRHPLIQTLVLMDFMFIIRDKFFIPQHLPSLTDGHHPKGFCNTADIFWEYVFDFGEFIYHHEYVFYSLVARLANSSDTCNWTLEEQFKHWVSFSVKLPSNSETRFTLICTKSQSKHDDNTIRVRVSSEFRKHWEESHNIKKSIAAAIEDIKIQGFHNLTYKQFFNCPRRKTLTSKHYITEAINRCTAATCCRPCGKHQCVRLAAKYGIPYIGVSREVVQFLAHQHGLQKRDNLVKLIAPLRNKHEKAVKADIPCAGRMVQGDDIDIQLNKWIDELDAEDHNEANMDKLLDVLNDIGQPWSTQVKLDLEKEFLQD